MVTKSRFYIGEDIEIQLECFDEIKGTLPVDISIYEFLLLLYTDIWEPIVMSTLDTPETVKVIKIEPNILQIHISSELTKNLRPGQSRLEVKASYNSDNWKSIATLSLIEFLPNQIAKK